jgi:myo-inositol-1-phosphate synthase
MCKSPVTAPGRGPVHDLFRQQEMLFERLRQYAEAAAETRVQAAAGKTS